MDDQGAEWQRLQQEFLKQWLGVDGSFAADPWAKLKELFMQPGGVPDMPASPPWNAFKAFAELLRAQAELMNSTRRRRVDVAAALQALLESLVRGIDAALAAQALATAEDATGAIGFGRAFAAWPALGLGREWQAKLQRGWRAWFADREADQQLRTLQWRALRAGCERCRRALAAPGPAITSLRGLYDLFVEQVEASWQDAVMTDEYARVFGARVNAALALRLALGECIQALGGLFELAGRAEVDALERRLRALEERQAAVATSRQPRPAPAAEAGHDTTVKVAHDAAGTTAPATARRRSPAKPRPAAAARKSAAPRAAPRRKPRGGGSDFDIAGVFARDDTKD